MRFPQPIQILGKPKVIAVDASRNAGGWEAEIAARICNVMRRQQVDVEGPIEAEHASSASDVTEKSEMNCIFLMTPAADLREILAEIGKNCSEKSKVLAIYLTDPTKIALANVPFALATLISTPSLTQKEAALFYPEFFSELSNHCESGIGIPMVRFCHAKANRLAPGKVEIRTEA